MDELNSNLDKVILKVEQSTKTLYNSKLVTKKTYDLILDCALLYALYIEIPSNLNLIKLNGQLYSLTKLVNKNIKSANTEFIKSLRGGLLGVKKEGKRHIEDELKEKVVTNLKMIQMPNHTKLAFKKLLKERVNDLLLKELVKEDIDDEERVKRVQTLITPSYNKAVRIARTEVVRVFNEGSFETILNASKEGADVLKMWHTVGDARVRDTHSIQDGEVRGAKEEFSNGLQYPGDPTGEPGEVINCRCFMDVIYKPI